MIKCKFFLLVFLAWACVISRQHWPVQLYSLEMGATYVCHPPSAQALKKKDRNTPKTLWHMMIHADVGKMMRNWCKMCPEQRETASICAWEHGFHDQKATVGPTGRIFPWQPLPLWPCHHPTSSKALQKQKYTYHKLVVSIHLKNIGQIGSSPLVGAGVKIKNVWNHHPDMHINVIKAQWCDLAIMHMGFFPKCLFPELIVWYILMGARFLFNSFLMHVSHPDKMINNSSYMSYILKPINVACAVHFSNGGTWGWTVWGKWRTGKKSSCLEKSSSE